MATNNQNGWLSGLGIGLGAPLSVVPEQQTGGTSDVNQFEQLDKNTASSNTLKVSIFFYCLLFLMCLMILLQRNPKMELTKSDLLKLLTYFEGEIQARDIAIAALKV